MLFSNQSVNAAKNEQKKNDKNKKELRSEIKETNQDQFIEALARLKNNGTVDHVANAKARFAGISQSQNFKNREI